MEKKSQKEKIDLWYNKQKSIQKETKDEKDNTTFYAFSINVAGICRCGRSLKL